MYKTIGILAHVDAGKTTLSEQLLLRGGALQKAGRVDSGDAFLDADPMERRRGITVFADQASFSYGDSVFQLIDTPGHADFAAEMERTLAVLDAAVLVVSAPDGVQGHTETIWQRLEALGVPVFFFLNKTDRVPPAEALSSLSRLTEAAVDLTKGLASAAEAVSLLDEALLDEYISHGFSEETFLPAVQAMISTRRLFPVFCGAALQGDGVDTLLHGLDTLLVTQYNAAATPGAQVYGIRRDRQGTRFALLKVTQGTLRSRMPFGDCKLGELRTLRGPKSENLSEASAGRLCAVSGVPTLRIGDAIGDASPLPAPVLEPLLRTRVQFEGAPAPVLDACQTLAEENPTLHLEWDETLQQLTLRVMGPVQLEVLAELLLSRFGLSVSFDVPQVIYNETIRSTVIGYGHFEPLRHYAEVVLRLSPGASGSGITFDSACPTDMLAANWQNLIRAHVFERTHRGVLTGAELTDVHITLLAGRAHEKHTEGGDFRQATYRAIRQGLMQAESLLLEPMLAVQAGFPTDCLGKVMQDFQRMHGETATPQMQPGERCRLRARVPLSEWGDYPSEFAALSRGMGALSLQPDGYAPCHNTAEVVEAAAYEPERDMAHTPDSVFCAHGAGYTVKWQEVPAHAHSGTFLP